MSAVSSQRITKEILFIYCVFNDYLHKNRWDKNPQNVTINLASNSVKTAKFNEVCHIHLIHMCVCVCVWEELGFNIKSLQLAIEVTFVGALSRKKTNSFWRQYFIYLGFIFTGHFRVWPPVAWRTFCEFTREFWR